MVMLKILCPSYVEGLHEKFKVSLSVPDAYADLNVVHVKIINFYLILLKILLVHMKIASLKYFKICSRNYCTGGIPVTQTNGKFRLIGRISGRAD